MWPEAAGAWLGSPGAEGSQWICLPGDCSGHPDQGRGGNLLLSQLSNSNAN